MPLELKPDRLFAPRDRTRFEKQARQLRRLEGFETFLPTVGTPLLPGYFFCRRTGLALKAIVARTA
jgi:hypothetical protein